MKLGLPKHSYDMVAAAHVNLARRILTSTVSKKERKDVNHQQISFLKSFVRIMGYAAIVVNLPLAVTVLILSEVLGILEEIGPWQTPNA